MVLIDYYFFHANHTCILFLCEDYFSQFIENSTVNQIPEILNMTQTNIPYRCRAHVRYYPLYIRRSL